MKKQVLWKKGRQVFAAIMAASVLMTSAIPEAMVSAAEEPIAEAGEAGFEEVQDAPEEEITWDEQASIPSEEETGEANADTYGADEPFVISAEEVTGEEVRTELTEALQARIAQLPSVEEFQSMDEDAQNRVLEEVNDLADQYYEGLSEAEQELVDAEKLEALLEYMSGQVAETAWSDTVSNEYLSYSLDGTTIQINAKNGNTYLNTTGDRRNYFIKTNGLDNTTIEVIPTFKYGGRFVEVTYKVKATKATNGTLGVGANISLRDTLYGTYENVKVIRQGQEIIGFQFQDDRNTSVPGTPWLQIYFAGKVSSKATTYWAGKRSYDKDEDNFYGWFTGTNSAYTSGFKTITERDVVYGNDMFYKNADLSTVLSWNVNLQKGASAEYKMLIGYGTESDLDQALDGRKVDYQAETISGFATGTYTITSDDKDYTFQIDADGGSISLQGTDANGESYDFTGKTLEVKDPDGSVRKFSIVSRPKAPDKVNVSGTTFSANTITIPASSDQEYILVPEGTELTSEMWAKAQKGKWWGITFDEDALGKALNSATAYVVYSRVSATDTGMVSAPSEASDALRIHSHAWVYKQDKQDEIEAYCTFDGCYQGETNPLKLTIELESWGEPGEDDGNLYYTGYPYFARVNDNITSVTGAACSDVTFYTAPQKGATSGGTKLEGEDYDSAYPREVGNYYATATLTVGEETSYTVVKAFSIERAPAGEQRRITNLRQMNRTYSGEAVKAEYYSELEEDKNVTPIVEYKRSDASDKTYTTVVPVDAGEYTVRVKYPETAHYQASALTGDFTIDPIRVEAVVSVENKDYDGTDTATITEATANGIHGQTLIITGLTGKFQDKNAGTQKWVEIDSTSATVSAAEPRTNPGNYTVWYRGAVADINKKDLTATVTAADKEYDGFAVTDVTATVNTGVDGEALTITGLTGTFANADAGENKQVTVDASGARAEAAAAGTSADNYNITYPETATATISPKPVKLSWSATDLIYTGKAQSVTAQVTNKANSSDEFVLTYDTNIATAVRAYTAKVTGLGNSNYTLDGAENTTLAWTISYPTVEEKNEPKPAGPAANESGWYTGEVTLTPGNGYRISTSADPEGSWTESLTVDADGENEITYYLKDKQGHITEAKTLTVKKDATAPTGEIKVGDSAVTGSEEDGSYFFKDTAVVQISGTDATSGVAKIEYQVVSKAKGETYQEDGAWTEGSVEDTSVTINANDNCVIYSRITDEAGNVTILHSKDIIVYTEVTGSSEADYTRTTGEDLVTDLTLNGNTVKEIKYGDKVLEENVDYAVNEDGRIVISSNYLETLPAGEHELTVSWNPFGADQTGASGSLMKDGIIKVSVNRADPTSAETKITNTGRFSKTYDGQPAEKAASESKNSSAPLVEYKEKGASDDSYTTAVPENAGTYVVRVTYPQDENYEASVLTEEFTIAPKEISIQWTGTSVIYNRQQQVPTATATGLLGSDTCAITVTGAQTAAGKYTATAASVSNPNYCLPKNGTALTAEFTIAPKEIGIQWTGTSVNYNGKKQVPTATATGLLGSDTCAITVTGAQTAAGKYTATAAALSNPNYCLPQSGVTRAFEIKEVSDPAAVALALGDGLKVDQTGSNIVIKWGKVKGASGYNVYVQYCGSNFTAKSLNQVKGGSKTSLTVKKVNGKKLNLKKNYKIYVEAYKTVNGKKIVMGRSITAHIVGRKNSTYTNVKGIKLQKSSITVKSGKTATIKATTIKVNRYRKQLSDAHAKALRYVSSNPSVAKVNANGKITGVRKGSCTIYVYARNGYAKKVKVTVK